MRPRGGSGLAPPEGARATLVGTVFERCAAARFRFGVAACAIAGCSIVDPLDGLSDHFGRDAGADAGVDAPADAPPDADADAVAPPMDASPPPPCDVTKDFGVPVPLRSVSTAEDEGSARASADELTVYFDGVREAGASGNASFDLFAATRTDGGDSFGAAARVLPPSDPGMHEYAPSLTDDGLTLFFERQAIGSAVSNIFMATRPKITEAFGAGSLVSGVNTSGYDANPFVRGNGSEIWFVATGADTTIDIFVARSNGASTYSASPVSEVSSAFGDYYPVISADGRTLYFASDRPLPGAAGLDVWVATRTTSAGKFDAPLPLANVNTTANEQPTWISADGCRLYIASDRPGSLGAKDIYVSTRPK